MGKMLLLHQVTKNICIIFGNTFSINEDKAIILIESVVSKENLYTCTSLSGALPTSNNAKMHYLLQYMLYKNKMPYICRVP